MKKKIKARSVVVDESTDHIVHPTDTFSLVTKINTRSETKSELNVAKVIGELDKAIISAKKLKSL
jgi:hypothetical protein